MKYRILGKTSLRVSVVGIGTWQLGGEWGRTYSPADATAILDEAQHQGINLIDTAECYGDHTSESLIGQAIEGQRDDWVVATKFGHHFKGHLDRSRHWTPAEVRQQLEGSLRALRTDYIDIYQYHSPENAEFENDALWATVKEFQAEGKVRHIGLSVSPNTNVRQIRSAPQAGIASVQIIYNRLSRQCEAESLPACRHLGLGVLARIPLASGYLSGKYAPGARFPANDVRGGRKPDEEDAMLREVQNIERHELPVGVNMAAWALAWCLQNPAVTCVIPGCKDARQVALNASAANLDLVSPAHPQAVR